jgi:hypothetical protein
MIIFDRDSFGDQLSSKTVMKPSGTANGMFLRQKNHCITEREKIIKIKNSKIKQVLAYRDISWCIGITSRAIF